ncbi:MAG: GNAT family N-acetyltransferase [Bacteroidota bacterium]
MLQLNFSPFPVLTTERLVLRQLTAEDEKEIFALRTDDAVNKYLDRLKARSVEEARKFIQKINKNISNNVAVFWGIAYKDEDVLIGTACYWNIIKENDRAEIGYELLPEHQGKGIMQEAIAAIIDYGFDTMKLHVIEAVAQKDNQRSLHLLQKFNFTRDTEQEKKMEGMEEYKDANIYSLRSIDRYIKPSTDN